MRNPLLLLKRRRRVDADFSEEIASHLAFEAERLVAEGYAPAAAQSEARRRFGNVGQAVESFHRARTIGWLEAFPHQLRRAARRLVRAPVFSITTVLTLTLGIGATTAVFSLVDGVLLRPLPFVRPGELVDLAHSLTLQGVSGVDQSDATYLYYRRANHVFSGVGAYRSAAVNLSGTTGDSRRAERVAAARVSASVFALLGIAPLRGRVLQESEDPDVMPIVVLGERLWRDRYGADPDIVGRSVAIDGITRQVIGVMPARFAFPDAQTALWLPIAIDSARTRSAAFEYRALARLRAATTIDVATADLQALLPQVPEAFPGRLTADAIRLTHMRPVVLPLRDRMVGGIGRALWVVFGAGAFLLLIVCANVANLFLVRAEERQHDLAVRRALGAGHTAIFAEFFAEGLLVATLGGMLGVALAWGGVRALRSLESGVAIPRLAGVGFDTPVLAVAAGITLLTALIMSVVPAIRAVGPEVTGVLVQTGRGTTAGRPRQRARRALVVLQMSLALVLVTGAGLMARSFRLLRAVPPGFDAAQSYAFRVALPETAYPTPSATVEFVTRAQQEMAALPGVRSIGVVSKLPLDDEGRRDTAVFVEDRPPAMGAMPNIHQVAYASPGAFQALGIPILQGRTFEVPDPSRVRLEVIVTRALAERYWSGRPVVDRRLRLAPDGPWFTVVGVTGDLRGTRLDEPPDETVYLPLVTAPGSATKDGGAAAARWTPHELAFVVRGTVSPRDALGSVQRVFRSLAPALPVYAVRTMGQVVARSTARTSFTLELLEIASLAALAIGAVGLYGVVSYMVSLRAREMAVRIALGAERPALRWLVLKQALAVAAVGIAVGLGAALALTRFLSALLFDVTPFDPVTVLGAVVVLTAVTLVAGWLPARRAAAVDPGTTLRMDA
jgi:putative ABC transport system permease protein